MPDRIAYTEVDLASMLGCQCFDDFRRLRAAEVIPAPDIPMPGRRSPLWSQNLITRWLDGERAARKGPPVDESEAMLRDLHAEVRTHPAHTPRPLKKR